MSAIRQQVRVWDLPTRLFHWALVVCVVGAFAAVKAGTLWMDWHVRFGLAVLVLISFRLVWGLVGPVYARFARFVRGPAAIRAYLGDPGSHLVGHNPLGGWSVLLMLGLFGFQAVSGLFSSDDILTSGPLAHLEASWSATLTDLHKATEWWMIALVAVHVSAVLVYQWVKRQNIIGPMVHGDAVVDAASPVVPARDSWAYRFLALALWGALGYGAWWLTTLGAGASASMDFM